MRQRKKMLIILAGAAIVASGWFASRNWLLERAMDIAGQRMEDQRSWKLEYENARWNGFQEVAVSQISIKNADDIVVFQSEDFHGDVKMLSLLVGGIKFDEMRFGKTEVQIVRKGGETKLTGDKFFSYATRIKSFVEGLPVKMPDEMKFREISLATLDAEGNPSSYVRIDSGHTLSAKNQLRFDLKGLKLKHDLIALQEVSLPSISGVMVIKKEEETFMVDESSEVQIGSATMHPSMAINFDKREFSGKASIPLTEAQSIISSMPAGMMNTIKSMQTTGKWGAEFALEYKPETEKPVSIDGKILMDQFAVTDFGEADPEMFDELFIHVPWNSERVLIIDEMSPDYVFLNELPTILKEAIILAEDADFREHRGFNSQVFELAVKDNLEEGRFVRGGSTIPMQLIRNTFLSPEKTISRKLEEMALVWCFEESEVVSKDKTLELYLNMIEWGDEIYGISEAADFYFGKDARDLNADECIFLAGIIPNPRMYHTFWESESQPTEFAENFVAGMALQLYLADHIDEETMDLAALPKLQPSAIAAVASNPTGAQSAGF